MNTKLDKLVYENTHYLVHTCAATALPSADFSDLFTT